MGKTDTIIIGNGSTMQIAATIGSGVAGGGQAVRYAGIQEFGGTVTVPSRARRSKNPSYLRSHPGQTKGYSFDVPSRSYLMSTIGERIQVYNRRLSRTIKDFYSGN
jgi:phage gpG-like protein